MLAFNTDLPFNLSVCRSEKEMLQFEPKETGSESQGDSRNSATLVPILHDDNHATDSIAAQGPRENQEIEYQHITAKRKKRAARKHVSSITLADLAKYFDLPISEASRNLKVGVSVLKRKCREFGIPRWPHRKIKSLDTLIHSLREEAVRQEKENKAAAMAVKRRQKMLERERKGIEKKPFMEIKSETKRFRQDVYKRRHIARALENNTNNSK